MKTSSGKRKKKIPKAKEMRIKKLLVCKPHSCIRKVALQVGVCVKTVANVMKRNGYKAYHKNKVQNLTEVHKENRVKSAKA